MSVKPDEPTLICTACGKEAWKGRRMHEECNLPFSDVCGWPFCDNCSALSIKECREAIYKAEAQKRFEKRKAAQKRKTDRKREQKRALSENLCAQPAAYYLRGCV